MASERATTKHIAEQLELLRSDIIEYRHLQTRRFANQNLKIRNIERCLSKIDSKTETLLQFWEDGERTVRFLGKLRKAISWLAKYVALPIAFVFAAGYWLAVEDWPEWFSKLRNF